MNGHVIPKTPIAVDLWRIRQCPHAKVFFLSHCHADHTDGLTSTWNKPIYCTEVTATLVKEKFKIEEKLLRPLELNRAHIIALDQEGQETMTVTLIDANHCPGAAMFVFEGYFGTILYTGDFRFHRDMLKDYAVLRKKFDLLYLDNTYCSPCCTFPSRDVCEEEILNIVKQNSTDNIVISVRNLGKEDLLVKIAQTVGEWIGVSPSMYRNTQILNLPNVFTTDVTRCRIRTEQFYSISKTNVQRWNERERTVVIVTSALYHGLSGHPFCNLDCVHVVPYSDHSSFNELREFVSIIRPKRVLPIVSGKTGGPFGLSFEERGDMNVFSAYIDPSPLPNVDIPPSVKRFMFNRSTQIKHSSFPSRLCRNHSLLKRQNKKQMGVLFVDSPDDVSGQLNNISEGDMTEHPETTPNDRDLSSCEMKSEGNFCGIEIGGCPDKQTEVKTGELCDVADMSGRGNVKRDSGVCPFSVAGNNCSNHVVHYYFYPKKSSSTFGHNPRNAIDTVNDAPAHAEGNRQKLEDDGEAVNWSQRDSNSVTESGRFEELTESGFLELPTILPPADSFCYILSDSSEDTASDEDGTGIYQDTTFDLNSPNVSAHRSEPLANSTPRGSGKQSKIGSMMVDHQEAITCRSSSSGELPPRPTDGPVNRFNSYPAVSNEACSVLNGNRKCPKRREVESISSFTGHSEEERSVKCLRISGHEDSMRVSEKKRGGLLYEDSMTILSVKKVDKQGRLLCDMYKDNLTSVSVKKVNTQGRFLSDLYKDHVTAVSMKKVDTQGKLLCDMYKDSMTILSVKKVDKQGKLLCDMYKDTKTLVSVKKFDKQGRIVSTPPRLNPVQRHQDPSVCEEV